MSAFKDLSKNDKNFAGLSTAEKLVESLKNAFPSLETAITNVSTAMRNGESAATIFSTGLKGLGTALTSSLAGGLVAAAGVAAVIGLVSNAYSNYKQSVLEGVQAATEAAASWEEEKESLKDYAERYEELKTSLDSGTLTEDEAYDAKSELLQIQSELNESYGEAASQLDLLNGEQKEQLALIEDLSVASAGTLLNERKEDIDEAIKQMEKLRNYTTQFLSNGDMDSVDAIEELVDKYDNLSLDTDGGGLYTLTFTGDASQATETMNDFAADVRALQDEYGNSNIFENLLDFSSESANSAQEILENYQSLYDEQKLAHLITDTTELADVLSDTVEVPEGINSYSDLYEEYADAVSDYNDALLEGDTSKIAEAKGHFDEVKAVVDDLDANDNLGGYDELFDDITDSLDTSTIALNDFDKALQGDLKGDLDDISSWSSEKLSYEIEALASGSEDADDSLKNLVDSARELGVVSGEEGEYTTEQINEAITALENLDYEILAVTESAEVSTDTLQTAYETAEESVSNLTTAVSESAAATGMSADSIQAVKDAYSGLDSYDASKLFETTADGVHLNREELEKLNDEYESEQMSQYTDALDTLEGQLADAKDELAGCTEGTDEYNAALSNVSSIETQIQEVQMLKSQYEGLTSAYNDFVNAQSGSDERDAYANVGDSYEELNELINAGWVGDSEITEYLDLLISADKRTKDNYEDWKLLTKQIEGTSYDLMDFFQYDEESGDLTVNGLANFLDALDSLFGEDIISVAEDGSYALDLTGDKLNQVADALGTTPEMVELIGRALIDAGFDIQFDGMYESTATLNDELQTTVEELETTASAAKDAVDVLREAGELDGFTYNLDAELDGDGGITDQLAKAKEDLLDESGEIKFEADTDEYKAAMTVITALTKKQQELENEDRAIMQVDVSEASSDVASLVGDLQGMQAQFDNFELSANVGADTSEAEAEIVSYAQEAQAQLASLEETNPQILADLGLDDEEFQDALAKVAETDVEAGVEVDQDAVDTIQNKLDGISAEALVSVGLSDSSTSAESALEDIQTTVETLNATPDVNINVTITTTGAEGLSGVKSDLENVNSYKNSEITANGTVTWGNETSEVDEYTAVEKSGNGTVKWTNDAALITKYCNAMKKASGTVTWGNDTSNVKTSFTATGTVKWTNSSGPGGVDGTAHSGGSAFLRGSAFLGGTHGDWGAKGSGVGLIGEEGPEILVSVLMPLCPVMSIDYFI